MKKNARREDSRAIAEELLLTTLNNPGVTMRVRTSVFTGTEALMRPGVDFDLVSDTMPIMIRHPGMCRVPFGVIDRNQARALHRLLGDFLRDYQGA